MVVHRQYQSRYVADVIDVSVALAYERGWPAVTTDPEDLRGVHPGIELIEP